MNFKAWVEKTQVLVLAQKMMYLYFFVKPCKNSNNANDHFCNFNSSDNAFQIRTCTLNKYLNNRLLLGEKYLRNHFKYVTLQCYFIHLNFLYVIAWDLQVDRKQIDCVNKLLRVQKMGSCYIFTYMHHIIRFMKR